MPQATLCTKLAVTATINYKICLFATTQQWSFKCWSMMHYTYFLMTSKQTLQ